MTTNGSATMFLQQNQISLKEKEGAVKCTKGFLKTGKAVKILKSSSKEAKQKENHVLSWEERFKIAIMLAEALAILIIDVLSQCFTEMSKLPMSFSKMSSNINCQISGGDLGHPFDIRSKVTWWENLDTLRQSILCTGKSVTKSTFTLEGFCFNSYHKKFHLRSYN